jgi:hypothetical protein
MFDLLAILFFGIAAVAIIGAFTGMPEKICKALAILWFIVAITFITYSLGKSTTTYHEVGGPSLTYSDSTPFQWTGKEGALPKILVYLIVFNVIALFCVCRWQYWQGYNVGGLKWVLVLIFIILFFSHGCLYGPP